MNHAQLFVFLFVTFVAYCVTNVNARGASYRKKVRKEIERKCNEEIMKKDFITINDKIVCDKTIQSVTKEYMKQICPAIIDLTLKEITEYYVIEGLTKEEFQDYRVFYLDNPPPHPFKIPRIILFRSLKIHIP